MMKTETAEYGSGIGALDVRTATLGKSFKLFVPQFPHLEKGYNNENNNNHQVCLGVK